MFSYPRYQKPSYNNPPEHYYYQQREDNDSRPYQHQFYQDSPRSSQHMKRKKLGRSKSFSKMNYNNYRDFNNYNHHTNIGTDYYYHDVHRLDGVRSVSPFTENRHYHHNSINRRIMDNEEVVTNNRRRVPPTCFVNLNQPMINPMIPNYCMQQSLGTCPTTLTTNGYASNNDFFFIPQNVPMIQPYFINQPNNSANFLNSSYYQPIFPNFMPMPTLHPDIIPQQTMMEEVLATLPLTESKTTPPLTESKATSPVPGSKATSPVTETKEISPVVEEKEIIPENVPDFPVLLRRKKSIMEEILSSFSLLGDENISYAPIDHSKPDDDIKQKTTTWDHTLYTSLSDALGNGDKNEGKQPGLSRKTSLKLFKKANALQNRQYIWCYRPFQQNKTDSNSNNAKEESSGLWAAFDMTNQTKMDYHYSYVTNMKTCIDDRNELKIENHLPDMITDDPSLILVLNRQSTLSNPVMVSFGDGIAWYYTDDCHLLQINCLPTRHQHLVVSNDLLNNSQEQEIKPLRRSKSMDGLANKFLNTVLGW